MAAAPQLFAPGHRMCAGCGAPVVMRQVLSVAKKPVVVSCATGCLEVATTIYPYTAWRCSFIHNAFENSAATMSGVEAAYRSLKRQGKLKGEMLFLAVGGDGGTYDIGLQSLSGMLERGHRVVYLCYDNGAYMNTGIQRSSATPRGADTTTTPAGTESAGKRQPRKDLLAIVAAHHIPYAAQGSPSHWRDLTRKAEKAFEAGGPAFLNLLAPCPRGWRYDTAQTIELTRLAVETCFWPLLEIEHGRCKITYRPKQKKPLTDFLKAQGRFKHLFKDENKHLLEELQNEVDDNWKDLESRCGEPG
ncbi:MAG: pyruvate ferredoxin oxidoreductase [Bacillota bacterium]|nr:MAG: pyruvate ferredoxin oxidoreductase [Bacillota bacterium]